MAEETNVTAGGQTNGTDDMQTGTAQDNRAGQKETTKTYTQEEYEKALQSETDKRVQQALATAEAKWQKDYEAKLADEINEAARLAKMSAEDRAKAEFDKRVKEFEDREAKHNAERLTFECTKQLANENLPVEMAEMLTGTDAETTKANIEAFKNVYNKAIQDGIDKKLRGRTPKTQTSQPNSWVDSVRRGAGLK
ncbi:MAG: DUF4355 domain-containing protein [Clostridiales bacterium]|nr:DUF4355 domain-containing protein [Clostridiales bacterium]